MTRILFICRASVNIGLGHFMRAQTLAEGIANEGQHYKVSFIAIGDTFVQKLYKSPLLDFKIVSHEDDIHLKMRYDVVFFDLLALEKKTLDAISERTGLKVSISPIFNFMKDMDMLFSRTKYVQDEYTSLPVKMHLGVKYALIQKHCHRINTSTYKLGLSDESFPIAISMGGGDAPNTTLKVLKALKKCEVPATFWVLLGEGYQHSYDELINEIKRNSNHEIIVAKTNQSMWRILSNCVLLLTTSGITSYEAAYAGLPTITLYQNKGQEYLTKELIENDVSLDGGMLNTQSLQKLNTQLAKLYKDKDKLLRMHRNGKKLLDNFAVRRVLNIINQEA